MARINLTTHTTDDENILVISFDDTATTHDICHELKHKIVSLRNGTYSRIELRHVSQSQEQIQSQISSSGAEPFGKAFGRGPGN